MELHLEDKVALVTGTTGGIGLQIAKALLEEGALLTAFYRGSEEKLSQLYSWMEERTISRDRVLAVEVDLRDPAQVEDSIERTLSSFDRLDVLINNAGYTPEMPFLTLSDEEQLKIMDINFSAPSVLMKQALKGR